MPTVLELYEKLKPKLGDEEARALLEFVDANIEQKAATKEDLQRAVAAVEATFRKEIQDVRREIQDVRKEIQEVKVDLLRWSFGFWLGAVAILSGIMFTLLRTVGPR
jgi:predicted  nucleic acid-binding Zn-ribbon protein